ncbi:hypothetical protein CDD82_7377 [Ophiocordyceps australis]|uniref:Uncharacterized protein n=1 Tax=Ophiocordyceps australis TaxID=1399860 RepID=A0A2C5YKK9_9HYPO|nr:hypothetical protein CDD82_7377 [Ophiocordyceps australis]
MMSERRKLGDVALDLLLFTGMMTAGLYVARNLLSPMLSNLSDPDREKHEQTRRQAKSHLERIKRREQTRQQDGRDDGGTVSAIEDLALNEYENLIALEMVAPEDIHVGFNGGFRGRVFVDEY